MTETSKLKLQLPDDNNTADIAVINANMVLLDGAVSAKADLPGADAVKAAPVDGDGVLVADSADSGKPKQILWSRLKVALKAVNDALYAAREHSHTKSQITDFPASMTPTAHKASHKTGGSDAITPADIGAQEQHVTRTVALSAAGWSNKSQTVPVSGVTASNTVLLAPAPASQSAYGKAKIVCTAQGSGTLTFTCETVPTAAVNVNVVILEV